MLNETPVNRSQHAPATGRKSTPRDLKRYSYCVTLASSSLAHQHKGKRPKMGERGRDTVSTHKQHCAVEGTACFPMAENGGAGQSQHADDLKSKLS